MNWTLLGFGPKYDCPEKFAQVFQKGDWVNESDTFCSFRSKEYITSINPEYKTLFDMFVASAKQWSDSKCFGTRTDTTMTWRSYGEVLKTVQEFGSGLKTLGYMKKDITEEMTIMGLMGRNHPEWVTAEYGCFGFGGTTVPFYESLSVETISHIINNCGLAVVVCDENAAHKLVAVKNFGTESLSTLIVYGTESGDVPQNLKEEGTAAGLEVVSFKYVCEIGAKNLNEFERPSPDAVYSFVFTSGSTGKFPKAALITHASALANSSSIIYEYKETPDFALNNGNEHYVSYLPIAHAMERTCVQIMLFVGGAIGFSQGIREKVMEDIAAYRPTFFVSVPRILNRIHDKIMSTVSQAGWLKSSLFLTALETKKKGVQQGYLRHPVYDAIVFGPLKKKLGLDRVTRIVTGSAPISAEVLGFYRSVFGVPISEGYGSTELTCIASGTHAYHMQSGHVGGPAVIAQIKLVSIPSMPHYTLSDSKHGDLDVRGRGEIVVRGCCVMREYYRNPEATAAAIDKDGFYHTGDVAAILPDNTLKIIDRKNNIFKLSNGEYVAPETIENKIVRASFINQAYVHGDTMHARLVAVVVVDPDTAIPYAKANNLPTDLVELCKVPEFQKTVLKQVQETGKAEELRGYEIPFKVYLEAEPFTEKNILTATMKLQRTLALAKYKDILESMLGEER